MKSSKGFTLIELLVVIAIIGILSSVVLASLNTARAKGSDAAIKSQLAAIRPQAEIVYDTFSAYGTTGFGTTGGTTQACTGAATTNLFGTTTISSMITSLINTSGTGNVTCATDVASAGTNPQKWMVAAKLKTDTTQGWCVDYTGASKQETWTAVDADAVSAACP